MPDRVRKAAHESGHWHTMRLNDDQPVPVDATSEFRRAVEPYLAPGKGEIARQATFKYLKLARAVTPQHPHRVLLRHSYDPFTQSGHPALSTASLADRRSGSRSLRGTDHAPTTVVVTLT